LLEKTRKESIRRVLKLAIVATNHHQNRSKTTTTSATYQNTAEATKHCRNNKIHQKHNSIQIKSYRVWRLETRTRQPPKSNEQIQSLPQKYMLLTSSSTEVSRPTYYFIKQDNTSN
jgi:hypothetical protein